MKKTLLGVLCVGLLFAGCTKKADVDVQSDESKKTDTVVLMVPPVSATYQSKIKDWTEAFNTVHPEITVEIETASWEDYKDKLSQQINAGNPPDIGFVGFDGLAGYYESGLVVDITDLLTPEQRADFDGTALDFATIGDRLYGLPAYMEAQCLGGNRALLEAAGADINTIQTQGWTYDDFYKIVQAGTTENCYGFVFANSGVAAVDMLSIMTKNAGMPSSFTADLKYAYTGKNFLALLQTIRSMIDNGIMPASAVQAGQRWDMFLTGQTMIFGKGLSGFEDEANANNAKLEAADGTAVAGSIPVQYVVLPVPTLGICPQKAQISTDGYVMFKRTNDPSPEHLKNVMTVMYYMATGDVGAYVNNELCLTGVAQSVRTALTNYSAKYTRDDGNKAAKEYLLANPAEPRPDIPAELSAKAIRLQDEVVIPQLQALLAGEVSAETMFNTVKSAAVGVFGADGVVQD